MPQNLLISQYFAYISPLPVCEEKYRLCIIRDHKKLKTHNEPLCSGASLASLLWNACQIGRFMCYIMYSWNIEQRIWIEVQRNNNHHAINTKLVRETTVKQQSTITMHWRIVRKDHSNYTLANKWLYWLVVGFCCYNFMDEWEYLVGD